MSSSCTSVPTSRSTRIACACTASSPASSSGASGSGTRADYLPGARRHGCDGGRYACTLAASGVNPARR